MVEIVPSELVAFLLPYVARWGVPYCTIKGTARLGHLVNSEDKGAL